MKKFARAALLLLVAAACSSGPGSGGTESLTVYSGREEDLVAPLFEMFTTSTGIQIAARYGDSAELAAQILEEGENSPADVFFAQDGGALGAIAQAGMFQELPSDVIGTVPKGFRATDGTWVGTSGRVRTVVYNTDELTERDLPDSIIGFADEKWAGALGWAPTNASFQAFVTGLRLTKGEQAARAWLRALKDNGITEYPKNTPIVQAAAAGEIRAGFVNHYYLLRILDEDPDAPAANYFIGGGDPGALVNVAGAGILTTTDQQDAAAAFLRYLVAEVAQTYFAEETFEYPLIDGVDPDPRLPTLSTLEPPPIDLADLSDLEATLEMLQEEGLL